MSARRVVALTVAVALGVFIAHRLGDWYYDAQVTVGALSKP